MSVISVGRRTTKQWANLLVSLVSEATGLVPEMWARKDEEAGFLPHAEEWHRCAERVFEVLAEAEHERRAANAQKRAHSVTKKSAKIARHASPTEINDFWAKMDASNGDACRLWRGPMMVGGYGQIKWQGRTRGAHSVAWELATGQKQQKGRVIRHLCNVRRCCNPAHLAEGSHLDNYNDAVAAGTVRAAKKRENG
jgi:hypothetical protein